MSSQSHSLVPSMEKSTEASTISQMLPTHEPPKGPSLCRDNPCHEAIEENDALDIELNPSKFPPIAIVGMALRLPGGISSPDEFWKFLIDQKDGLCEVPNTRYNLESFFSESTPRSVKTRKGYFLQEDPAYFDADFFSISQSEAAHMDPQQRQLLEVVWECLESAGETRWRGREIGCFVGVYGEDWLELSNKDFQSLDRYHVIGTGQFALSNRISFEYDFQGPSMTIQTGCSSSLIGLHEACQALYSGECSGAIVAGTNLIFAPTMTTTMSENMVLSPSGMCKTFDDRADGYGRGEAVNAIYIKPLESALRNKDPVRAVIRATSTNCDGRTPSITTPGSLSQERLIRKTYKKAGIENICETAFFECHGTGTIVGDTAEASVVAKLFQDKGTIIGSVKPNIGHSEGASGISSLIKAVLSLENRAIPPNIFFNSPNHKIPFKEANLEVPTALMKWPKGRSERISVNCFGIGGSNAHVILDSMVTHCSKENSQQDQSDGTHKDSLLLVISARDKEALQRRIQGITEYANDNLAQLHDLAHTLGVRRVHLEHRAFAIALPDKPLNISAFQICQAKSAKLTLVFTGQGAQWAGMGKDLMDKFPSFKADMQFLNTALTDLHEPPEWSLPDELAKNGSSSRINSSEFSQPLCTALQIGLVNILCHMGIQASSVVGHSSGEIAAAYAAGAITARSAIRIAYLRGKAAISQEGRGAMLAIGLGRETVSHYLEEGAVLACENSPNSVTLSGDVEVIGRIRDKIKEEHPDTLCRTLKVKTAYHSHHMAQPGQEYETYISDLIELNKGMLPLFSTVIGEVIKSPAKLDAVYWRRNLQSPVLFCDAVNKVLADTKTAQHFLEIGPHSALSGPLRQIFKTATFEREPVYIPTLTRNTTDSRSQVLHALGCAHVGGFEVKLSTINGHGKVLTNLPLYPWQHAFRHWHESRLATQWRHRQFPHHELLGARVVESSDLEPSWRNILRLEDVPWILDHVLQSNVVFPAAGYIAMAGEAIRQLYPEAQDYSIKNLVLRSPLLPKDDQHTEMIFSLKPVKLNDLTDSEWYTFTIMTHDGTDWMKHCQGQVRSHFDYPPSKQQVKRNIRVVNSDQWYRVLDRHGLSYGSSFRGLTDIAADPVAFEADATITNRENSSSRSYTLHPTVIDQCLQLISVALANGISRHIDRLAIPAAIGHLYIGGHAPEMRVAANLTKSHTGSFLGNCILTADEKPLLSLRDAAFFTINDQPLTSSGIPLTAEIRWSPDIRLTPSSSWVPPPLSSGNKFDQSKALAKIACLYILDTEELIADASPTEWHISRFRNSILVEASKMRSGENRMFPDLEQWTKMNSEQRHQIIKTINQRWVDDEGYSGAASCLQAVWENCLDFVAGTKLPLDVLMYDNRLEKYYDSCNQAYFWDRPIQLLGSANPKMRVLEIGAGTGSATRKVLDDLMSPEGICLYSKYVFTDVSPGFTVAAQEKFNAHRNLEFQVLDISHDPEEQGFEPGSFDLVIASNVLHATPCLRQTLENIYQLLSSTGKLFLHEICPDTLATDYVMGVLPGWWVGEKDGRPHKPYVSPERWDHELQATGFTGIEAFGYDALKPFQLNFTMISGKMQQPTKTRVTLITREQPSPWAHSLVERLREHGCTAELDTLDSEPSGTDVMFLLDTDGPYLYDIPEQSFLSLQKYITKITGRLIWVTQSSQFTCKNPCYGLIYGFARTLRREMGADFSIFETDVLDLEAAESVCQVYDSIKASRESEELDPEYEFSYQGGVVHIGRCHWTSLDKGDEGTTGLVEEMVMKLDVSTAGLLDTLHWTAIPQGNLGDNDIEIQIRYVGLNFRDLMLSLGLVGNKEELGLEGSGFVRRIGSNVKSLSAGDRVVTFHAGLLQSRVIVPQERCFKVPNYLSLEEVATMPTVYATAIYSLIELASVRKGQTVLIHSACGGVGLASIQICQHLGAEIFATVGSEEKVQYLMDQFGITRSHIFNSRSTAFLPDLMRETNGCGADIVLNSLAGELLHASWECVANRGKMIELGKRDFMANGNLSMTPFARNRAFFGVDLLSLCEESQEAFQDLFHQILDCVEQGKIKPIQPVTKFEAAQIQDAFRHMQKGVHMGKILVEMPKDLIDLSVSVPARGVRFSPERSYLLVGGLGGLGRTISTWMVENGARHLVYLSRSAGESADDQNFLRQLKQRGCEPLCILGSVTSLSDVQKAVRKCIKPLAGVLQLSTILFDRTFDKMSHTEWVSSLDAKVSGTWNLHHAVEQDSLDFFVLFSSNSGLCGNTGQSNYAAANTFLESFTQYRREQGLPCSALSLGPVEEAGLLSRDSRLLQNARATWTYLLSEAEVICGLELAIKRCGVTMSSPIIVGLATTRLSSDPGVRTPWTRDMRYAMYHNIESERDTCVKVSNEDIKALIARVKQNPALLDDPEAETFIRQELGKLITQHMANSQDLNDEEIARIAIDSLMSIELRGWARRNLGLDISLVEISKAGTVGRLGNIMIEHLRAKYGGTN